MNKELKKKFDALQKRNNRFRRWENGLNATITSSPLLTIFSAVTKAPIDWTNIWLLNLISNSTYGESSHEKIFELFGTAIANQIVKGFEIKGKLCVITLNDDTQIKFAKITDFVAGIEKDIPELLTTNRHGHCHMNSFSLANNLEPDCNLCSAFCSAQSHKKQFPHSWIEAPYNGHTLVMDCNYNVVMDKQGYYRLLKPQNVVKISNKQVKSDTELIFQTSFAHKDVRMYCFFPDEVRAEVQKELSSKTQEHSNL